MTESCKTNKNKKTGMHGGWVGGWVGGGLASVADDGVAQPKGDQNWVGCPARYRSYPELRSMLGMTERPMIV